MLSKVISVKKNRFSVESDEEASSNSLSPLQRDRCNTWPRILLERYSRKTFEFFSKSLRSKSQWPIQYPIYPNMRLSFPQWPHTTQQEINLYATIRCIWPLLSRRTIRKYYVGVTYLSGSSINYDSWFENLDIICHPWDCHRVTA